MSTDASGERHRATDDSDVSQLLKELDELQELDRRRRLEPRDSVAYARAVNEVERRSRRLIERLRVAPSGASSRRVDGSEGQLA